MLRHRLFALAAALAASTLISAQTRADIITFVDTTDTISVSHTGTDTTLSGTTCPAEGFLCVISLSRGTQTITSPQFIFTLAEDPSRQFLSDMVNVSTDVGVELDFASFPDGGTSRCLGGSQTCNAQETGLPQLAGTITWSGGGSTDQIFVQSDAEPVPEPSSLLVLAAALGALGLVKRYKLAAAT
jgi:hypothetical protein